jgi:hypothetical protein
MKAVDRLKHKLMILAGLPPQSPTNGELQLIIEEIVEISATRRPTEFDWKKAAGKHVPNAGRCRHAGEDMSDLNALLIQILSQEDPRGTSTVRK